MPRLRPERDWPRGTVRSLPYQSTVLQDNPWGDPTERELNVYLPHDYSDASDAHIALWDLAAYTNTGPGHLNWRNQGENLAERLDRLIGREEMPSAVVVIPDCYTSLGGNQYVNSPSTGRYADYLVEELVPLVSERFNVLNDRAGRGLFGKSSGGFGALYHAIHFPDTWGAAASHSGDAGFDLVFPPEFPVACNVLAEHNGDIDAFISTFWRKNNPSGRDYSTMMVLAMAASYDPDPDDPARIRLPFDLRTCERDLERWARWLAFDPVMMVEKGHAALKRLEALYIDVGFRDQYQIHFGTRRLADKLEALGVDFHFEEFDGTHSSIDWRLDLSLPYLARALKIASSGSY